jgi:hypothetical protein
MLRRCFPFRLAISLVSAIVFSSITLRPSAVAQNLLPIQVAITQQVQAIPDPPNPSSDPINVVPFEFDPFGTNLVRASWMTGIGCPTNATTTSDGSTFISFTDLACPTGDPKDKQNQGLLLVKTGPTTNYAASGAKLLGPGAKGVVLTELGYDLRKPIAPTDPRGSHCGAGAPRFNVVTSDGVNHFVGCNSPPAMFTSNGSFGWIRLRWGAAQLAAAFPTPILPGSVVSSITIIFDEGQDASGGPDEFGLAVLDNIDVNGTLAGRGPGT